MTPAPAPAAPPKTPRELSEGLDLSDEAKARLTPGVTSAAYFDALVAAALYPDAIRFTARLMDKPQAVWWGCLCAWHAARGGATDEEKAALKAVVVWLRGPTDEARRAAGDAGKAAGGTTPAGMLGYAAFMAEGSMSPPGKPEVPPKPTFTADFVAQAVLGASRKGGAAGVRDRQKTFLTRAVEVIRGTNKWS